MNIRTWQERMGKNIVAVQETFTTDAMQAEIDELRAALVELEAREPLGTQIRRAIKAEDERDAFRIQLAIQVALVEKCMVAMNENADKGEKAEAEVGRLVRKLALEREEFKAELDRIKAQPVQEPLPYWYTLASDGLVCLCADEQDAIHEAKKADLEYPSGAPRKAVRLYLAAPVQPAPLTDATRKAVALAYGHLWHINNEPLAPIPLRSEESASYAARKLLRDLLTHEERGEAINAVRELLGVRTGGAG